uniref:Ig-like domain-containing protein n=1 Tax=Equus asinus asinus TaxID=83772 RepID=A0A8C4LW82_EQUAS
RGHLFVSEAPRSSTENGISRENDFVFQLKGQCYFTNGTERVRLVTRLIYNREEFVRFDSDVGEFQAVTELGRHIAEDWNGQKDVLEQKRAELDTVCRHNYQVEALTTLQRRGELRWFRNDQEERAGIVSTPLIRNGDWTFQILVMLEMTPQRGDVYTCHVEHPSPQSPITVEWRTHSESSQSKMLCGIRSFVLGLSQKGKALPSAQGSSASSCSGRPPPLDLERKEAGLAVGGDGTTWGKTLEPHFTG